MNKTIADAAPKSSFVKSDLFIFIRPFGKNCKLYLNYSKNTVASQGQSVRRAVTGSFIDAMTAGIRPPITDVIMQTVTSMRVSKGFMTATLSSSVSVLSMAFVGISESAERIIPIMPEKMPIINVSALKTLQISLFLAPRALKIPISLVLSITEE